MIPRHLVKSALRWLLVVALLAGVKAGHAQKPDNGKLDPSTVDDPAQYASVQAPKDWAANPTDPKKGQLLYCHSAAGTKVDPAVIRVMALPNYRKITEDQIRQAVVQISASKSDPTKGIVLVEVHDVQGHPGYREDVEQAGSHEITVIVLLTRENHVCIFNAVCPVADWPKYQSAIEGSLASLHIQ